MERTSNTYTESQLSELWKLWNSSDWIQNYSVQLESMYSAFPDVDERQMINKLLNRFTFLDLEEGLGLSKDIAEKIINNSDLTPENTFLIPRSYGKNADGSKAALYQVITALEDYSWEYSNTTSFKSIISESRPNIVVLDDFVGSGNSMLGTLEWFRNNLNPQVFSETNFYAYCFVGMEASIDKLSIGGYFEVHYSRVLKAGISQMSEEPEMELSEIKRIQSIRLKLKIGNMKLSKYLLGYGDAEALFFNPGFRVPNSLFPLFWWREGANPEAKWEPFFKGR